MSWRKSLLFRFVVGFAILVSPLVLFLFFHNMYAIKVVKEQVSGTNDIQLTAHVNQTDELMEIMNDYLYVLSDREPDVGRMGLFPYDSDDYVLNKRRVYNRLDADIDFFRDVDSIFVYNLRDDDLVIQARDNYDDLKPIVIKHIRQLMASDASSLPNWHLVAYEPTPKLMKIVKCSETIALGATIDIRKTMEPLKFFEMDRGGGIVITDSNGVKLVDSNLSAGMASVIQASVIRMDPQEETIETIQSSQADYMIFSRASDYAPIRYSVIIPETIVLKRLPFFQNALYFIPVGGVVILLLYFMFLQNVLLRPMNKLIRAMNQIMRGNFSARLDEDKTTEFIIVNRTFNQMISEITSLKINVYEEKLRTKEAEFKHLQAQIKPHFYLNSLNIINSLVVTKQYDLIHRMTRYLAEYFRFSISTNQSRVLLVQELRHTQNYLEIQKLRFPGQLSYEIELKEDCEQADILPLSIQTFVENAILHGFVDRHNPFYVHITVEHRSNEDGSGYLWIRIRDNGTGFPDAVLRKLQSGAYGQDAGQNGSLGIYNVLLRLHMSYEDEAQIHFDNAADQGAVVTLCIPYRLDQRGLNEDAAI